MNSFFNSFLLRRPHVGIAVALVAALSGCSSLKPLQEDPGPPPKVAGAVDAQDYITKVDLARVKLGMTASEVKNRIGPAMLGEPTAERWDYVVKEGRAAAEQYNTWAVYFKDGKVLQIAQLQTATEQTASAAGADDLPSNALPSALPARNVAKNSDNSFVKPNASATASPTPKAAQIKPKPEFKAEEKQDPKAETASPSEDPTAEIGAMLRSWVAAWSGKKTNSYLSFYASNFKHGMASRSAWVAQRRARLGAPGAITLDLSAIQVTLINPTQAEVKFIQRYKSASFSDQGKKRMVLVRQGSAWKILEETFDN